jgi:5-methylcytosine-specific restriction endonuclease McrA
MTHDEQICSICGEDDPRVVKERHHIFGRNNGDAVTLLCRNCHDKITSEQNKFPPKVRRKEANPEQKDAYIDASIGGLLKITGDMLIKRARKKLRI